MQNIGVDTLLEELKMRAHMVGKIHISPREETQRVLKSFYLYLWSYLMCIIWLRIFAEPNYMR